MTDIHLRLTEEEVDVLRSAIDYYTDRDEFYESSAEDTTIAFIETKLDSRDSGWIRVDERLPDVGELVWLYGFDELGDDEMIIGKLTGDGSYLETNGHIWLSADGGVHGEEHECDLVVSHWHSLPQPPAREG